MVEDSNVKANNLHALSLNNMHENNESHPMLINNANHQSDMNNNRQSVNGSAIEQNIRICLLNCCGLKSKLIGPDFEEFISNYDYICLTETKLDSIDALLFDDFDIFSKCRKKCRASSGGVALLSRKNMTKLVTIHQSDDDFSLWFTLNDQMGHSIALFCIAYIPPENTKYSNIDMFDMLENQLLAFNEFNSNFCLLGDLNARTADKSDILQYDKLIDILSFDEFSPCVNATETLEAGGFPVTRTSQDVVINKYGDRFINLCKNVNICIVNSRCGQDVNIGKATCQDVSVVDYIACSPFLFNNICQFEVINYNPMLSDKHKPLSLTLRKADMSIVNNVNEVIDDNIKECKVNIQWENERGDKFVNNVNEHEVSNVLHVLNSCDSKQITLQYIDNVASYIGNIFMESAIKSNIMSVTEYKSGMGATRPKKKYPNKPWFNEKCKDERSKFFCAKLIYSKDTSSHNKTLLKKTSVLYKRELKKARWVYARYFNHKLKELKNCKPKDYWNIINYPNKKNKSNQIKPDQLLDHFRNLNSAEPIPDHVESDILDKACKNVNSIINENFTEKEIVFCIGKLKNNKAYGCDLVINEYIKSTKSIMLPIYLKLFNIVLNSGIIPSSWIYGIITPIYKNKGNHNNPDNYRGITILSCIGKLFTSLLNERLTQFAERMNLIGTEQAGFRKQYSTIDHIYTLKSLIDIYLSKGKKLYCTFVDYKKAFDSIDRINMWSKLLKCGINGNIFSVIYNLYKGAKSSIKNNNKLSDCFPCLIGVRQGENLSPLLFSLYLNDLKEYMSRAYSGLNSIHHSMIEADLHLEHYLKIFVLLYADDTIILAENEDDMQKAVDALFSYCSDNKLHINTTKTKVLVFSKGKIRNRPKIKFGDDILEVVDEYVYLGIIFNYNGKFNKAKDRLCTLATNAMFGILNKGRRLQLDIDTQIHLFNSIVEPILIYGSEIWGYENVQCIERVQLRFLKLLLMVKKSTPSVMVRGELGIFPIDIRIQLRCITYWSRILNNKHDKLCFQIYSLMLARYHSKWLVNIKAILDKCGLSYVWLKQGMDLNVTWLKITLSNTLKDQYKQEWNETLLNSNKCLNYRIFKDVFKFEAYLTNLPNKLRIYFTKFRCRSHHLPIEEGVFKGIHRNLRLCIKCNKNQIGDEFHYIFQCTSFKRERLKLIPQNFLYKPSIYRMAKLFNSKGDILVNLCRFITIIMNNMN